MAGVNLATAYYQLIPSMGGNQAAITTQMGAAGAASSKSFSSKFGSGISSNLKTIGIAAAAAAAVGFVKGAVAEGREAQKVGALTAQIIKSTGGAANVTAKSVGNLSTAISKKTGIDDEAIQTGSNVLLAFKNIRNEAGAGNKVFDEATRAATDLSTTPAFNGNLTGASKALGKALSDPVKGLGGLSKAGIKFTAGQQKQIAAMVKGGDLLGAQNVILGEIKGRVGGAAAAQGTAAEKMARSWDALKESIGTALIPVLDKLWLGLSKVINFIGAHQSVMIAIAAIIGVVLVAALVAAAAAAWTFTVALLANPITWIVIAIIALIAGIVLLIKNWDKVKAKTTQVWAAMKAAVAKAWAAIVAGVSTGVTRVLGFVKSLPQKILSFLGNAGTWLLHIGEDIINGLITGIGNGFAWVKAKIQELGGNILTWAKQILHIGSPSKLMADEVGKWIPAGIAMGIDSNASSVHSSMASLTADLGSSARLGAGIALSGRGVSGGRVALTITNWHEGTGYFEHVAGGLDDDQLAFAGTVGRMNR